MNITLTSKRAVGYLRVSTPGQAGDNHHSLETQEGRYKEYRERNGLLPIRKFVDVVSGRRDDRKEYERILDYVMEGSADVIVARSLIVSDETQGRYFNGIGNCRTLVSQL